MSQLSTTNVAATKSFDSKIKTALSKPSWRVALLLGLVSFGMGVTLSLARWPVPFIHDEFSYLLAADTFCEGRLTNPTHPHWQHFESFHIIQQPSYASKYPPGQGLFLALGQWATGHPIAGVWLLSALTAAACYWMLLGWVSPRWAFVGGVIYVLHPGYQLFWGQSYWGGTLAFLGGALVSGAAARIIHHPKVSTAAAMGTGTLLLACSRPYEGLVFCLLSGAMVLVGWKHFGMPPWKSILLRTALPMATILLAGGFALAHHNKSVTGSSTTLPYQIHEETYTVAPLFLWQEPGRHREHRHEVIANHHHGWMMDAYSMHDSLFNVLQLKRNITEMAIHFFFPLPLVVCALFLFPVFWMSGSWAEATITSPEIVAQTGHLRKNTGKRPRRFGYFGVLAIVMLSWLASMFTAVLVYPHYLAPVAPLLLLFTVWGLRYAMVMFRYYLPSCKIHWLILAFVLCQAVYFGQKAVAHATNSIDSWPWHRASLLAQFEATPDKHLVFVHYQSEHISHYEWVYNRADIDQSQVVWAREMDPKSDQALVDYFSDRKIWRLEVDRTYPKLLKWHSKRATSNSRKVTQ